MKITNAISNFVREPLLSPFGFKGGYLSELWQVVVQLDAEEYTGVGTGIQSVLWSDASVFSSTSQAGGNSYMFAMTDYALKLAKGMEFTTPLTCWTRCCQRSMNTARSLPAIPICV